MPTPGRPIPDGYHTVTPYLIVREAARAIEFYAQAFGAREIMRMPSPDGAKIMHAEMRVGDSTIMVSDEFPEFGGFSPAHYQGTAASIFLYVEDADAVFGRAVKAGATALMPVADMFWGDRFGKVRDPFGHEWAVATHKWDMTPEEIQKAGAAAHGG